MNATLLGLLLALQPMNVPPSPPATPTAAPIIVPSDAAVPPTAEPPDSNGLGGGFRRRLPVDLPDLSRDDAVIRNSGATNLAPYTIVVHPDATADVYIGGSTRKESIGTPQMKWLFLKLREAMPLGRIAVGRCMKSASFGTSTTILYQGESTPDRCCGGGTETQELMRTIGVIAGQLRVSPLIGRRRLL